MTNRSDLPQPVELAEIDAAWLTGAFRMRHPDVTVRAAEVVDMQRSTSTKVRLRLDLDEAGRAAGIPDSVILKGGFEPHSRAMYGMHEREVRGYRDVYPVLPLPIPACYYADLDPDRRQGLIIMEDLVRRGVRFCHPLEPQSFEAVARRLTVLAQHHARTWDSPEFAAGGKWSWVEDVQTGTKEAFSPYLEPSEWRRFVDSPRGAAASVKFHDRHWMADTLDRMITFAKDLPQVVVHGDTHLGNLYVDGDGAPGFFDSLPGRSPAMEEVSYHLCGALDLGDRRRWERPLVMHYLEALKAAGVTPPSFDEAMHQYGVFLARGYLVFLCNEAFFQAEAINTAYVARFSSAMLDHDTLGLLRQIG
jgi:hypothetical protein